MKRFLYLLLLTATTFVYGCSDYDDSQLSGRLDDIKERIAKLQDRIASLNSQLADLSELTSGNVITEMTEDSEGNYIITYKDNKNEEKSIVLATVDQMLNVPLLGIELDPQNNLYYWTVTADGKTSPLLDKAGEKVPVSGYTPEVSVDAEGFWTVNGERLNDAEGDPIEANDGESCLFKDIARDANGNLSLTLGDGKVITLPIQQVLNLTLSTAINTTVVDPTVPATIEYELHGEHAAEALVGIAEAEGVEIVLDRKQQRITVTFPTGFDDGYMIAMAYDLQEHTVLRPVFFTKATSDRIEIRTAEELVQFAENVNAGTGAQRMTAVLMNDIDMTKIASWIPIGNGSFVATASESKVEGAAFEGTFDGQGHALLNCKMTGALTSDNQVYGLFGILKGATVRNLVLGAESGDDGVVHRFGQRNDLDRRHRRRLRRLEDREMHQLSTDDLRRQQLGKQADDHGARRLRLRRRHERGYRFATDRFDKLRCTESGSGCRQRQRIHLDSGRRHRRILEHLPHIDLRQSVPALHKSRRHDRFDRDALRASSPQPTPSRTSSNARTTAT